MPNLRTIPISDLRDPDKADRPRATRSATLLIPLSSHMTIYLSVSKATCLSVSHSSLPFGSAARMHRLATYATPHARKGLRLHPILAASKAKTYATGTSTQLQVCITGWLLSRIEKPRGKSIQAMVGMSLSLRECSNTIVWAFPGTLIAFCARTGFVGNNFMPLAKRCASVLVPLSLMTCVVRVLRFPHGASSSATSCRAT